MSTSEKQLGLGLLKRVLALFDQRSAVTPTQKKACETVSLTRCGGSGSKISGDVLTRALSRLDIPRSPLVMVGCHEAEDASVHRPPEGKLELQTIDFFKTPVDDPYLFGRLAAVHAVGDLHAMNAIPFSALALVTLPLASPETQEEWLFEMMRGALREFASLGITLMGGHTSESETLGLGFSLTGYSGEMDLFGKRKLRPGDVLVLTKPVGTGALLAALARRRLPERLREPLFESMLRTNAEASKIFRQNGVKGCTDITGFGLAGHLMEMLAATKLRARLTLSSVPLLEGFKEIAAQGILSSLHAGNESVSFRLEGRTPPVWLFDPQTCGGLLAGVPVEKVDGTLKALHAAGYPEAMKVGVVETAPAGSQRALILE